MNPLIAPMTILQCFAHSQLSALFTVGVFFILFTVGVFAMCWMMAWLTYPREYLKDTIND